MRCLVIFQHYSFDSKITQKNKNQHLQEIRNEKNRRKAIEICTRKGIVALESQQCAIYEEQSFLQIPVFLVSNYHLATMMERQPIQCFARVEIWCFNKMFGSSAQCPPATYTWGESANERGGGRFCFSEPESFMMTMLMAGPTGTSEALHSNLHLVLWPSSHPAYESMFADIKMLSQAWCGIICP